MRVRFESLFEQADKFKAILPAVRKADLDELQAQGWTPDMYFHFWSSPERYVAYIGDRPIAMFGLYFGRGMNTVWALGTDLVEQYPFEFLRWSRTLLDTFAHKYRGIRPICLWLWEDYPVARRWVEWLGFEPTPHWYVHEGNRSRLFKLVRYQ